MFHGKLKKQNEEIKRLKRENERERVGGMNCLGVEMAQTGLFEKAKALFERR